MLTSIKNLFGLGPRADFAQLVKKGAVVVDVRTPGEFQMGHIRGAINIPVDQLRSNIHKLKDKHRPIITCCASGMRSATAKSLLASFGYAEVYNGGGWQSLQKIVDKSA